MPHMVRSLRILHLEDHPNDVTLIRAALDADGLDCQIQQVSSGEAFTRALELGGFDLILSDRSLPDYDDLRALALVKRLAPATPFILVSGSLDEQAAERSLRGGAAACVLKDDLARLCRVVRETLDAADDDRTRRQA